MVASTRGMGRRRSSLFTPASMSVSPVINASSLSEIFSTSHWDRPKSISARARSRLSHRGGRRFGSKEMRQPWALAYFRAARVALRAGSPVEDRVPK